MDDEQTPGEKLEAKIVIDKNVVGRLEGIYYRSSDEIQVVSVTGTLSRGIRGKKVDYRIVERHVQTVGIEARSRRQQGQRYIASIEIM